MTDQDPEGPVAYFEFRDHMAADLRKGLVRFTPEDLVERAIACSGLSKALAAEWVERFVHHTQDRLERGRRKAAEAEGPRGGDPPRPK